MAVKVPEMVGHTLIAVILKRLEQEQPLRKEAADQQSAIIKPSAMISPTQTKMIQVWIIIIPIGWNLFHKIWIKE